MLVNTGRLVRALEFHHFIDVNHWLIRAKLFGSADNNTGCIHLNHHTTTAGRNSSAGVTSNREFHTSTNQWRVGTQQWHGLTLHVRPHQGAVRIVIFKEWNKRSSNRYNLLRRHVDIFDVFRSGHQVFTGFTTGYKVARKFTICGHVRVCLCNRVLGLFHRRHVNHFVGDFAFDNAAIRAFDKAILIDASKGRERVNQTDVRAFRRFNRADTAIVGRVYVADFKSGTFTGQTTGAEGGQTTFVRNLGQWVGLIHKLGQLA